jgi:DNA (cytosine-5)-methyltransferase 1
VTEGRLDLKLRHLDLFSGIGGFSLGLERTGGFETVGFCDNDKKTHLVLKKHWPNVPIYDDVSTLKGSDLGTIDIITGGFPCQDLSVAGKGAGLAGARSGLWFEFHRLIKETQPKWVIAENVAVLRSRGLDQVLRSLDEIGYDAEWHCIPASAVGAPHRRDRIWIVAYSNGCLEANGGKCTDFKRKGDGGGVEQGGSGQDDRQGCFRGSRGCSKDDVAHTDSKWQLQQEGIEQNQRGRSCNSSIQKPVAYSGSEGLERLRIRTLSTEPQESVSSRCGSIVRSVTNSDFWKTEPQLGRVADGIPNRMDRLKQLGNSLVPQIPEIIGYAILEQERNLL